MRFEPVLFDSLLYETASEAVLFCKEHLERNGQGSLARVLDSIDAVNTPAMGRVARHMLLELLPKTSGRSHEHVEMALRVVERALDVQPLKAAS